MTLAHAGGVPETLAVVLPLVALYVLVRLGRRRARQNESDDDDTPAGASPPA